MTELEKEIKKYADSYYSGNELISDQEYDALIERLKIENPKSEILKGEIIGSDLTESKRKCKLPHSMGTLAKCNSDQEMKKWWEKHVKDSNEFVAELKIDGSGILLEYKKGKLVFAYSRGDGVYGQDFFEKAKRVPTIPSSLDDNFSGCIRGEVFMRKSVFEKYFSDRKNPRNMSAGLLNQKGYEDVDKLDFIAYDVFDDDRKVDNTEMDKIRFLEKFFQVPVYLENPTLEQVIEIKNKIVVDGEIPCDGVVCKRNKVDRVDLERKTPLGNVAFKPNLQKGATVVKNISWQLVGRYLAPVAEIEPVKLEGTTVTKASLSNVNIMNKLGVYVGAQVIVSKHGLIIPAVDKVLNPKQDCFDIPETCPVCGEKIVVNKSGNPECLNEECPRKVGHRFKKMLKVFNIKKGGVVFVKNLEEANISVEEFLKMCNGKDPKVLNKFAGSVNGEKVYEQMNNVMNSQITPAQFLAIFDEKMFDEKRIRKLVGKSIDEILDIDIEELKKIKYFSEKTGNKFLDFLKNNKEEIETLRKYFNFKNNPELEEFDGEGFEGKTFCFTGKACKPRKELQKIVEDNGGKNKDIVSKGLSYLVTDDTESGSAKNKKAKELGIPIITSEEFLSMVDGFKKE